MRSLKFINEPDQPTGVILLGHGGVRKQPNRHRHDTGGLFGVADSLADTDRAQIARRKQIPAQPSLGD